MNVTRPIEPPTTHEEAARRIALDCEGAYSGIGWSANDTDDLTDRLIAFATTVEREALERAVAGLRATRENFISVNRALEIVVTSVRAAGSG